MECSLKVFIHVLPLLGFIWDFEAAKVAERGIQRLRGQGAPPESLRVHQVNMTAPKIVACDDQDVLAEYCSLLREDSGREPGFDLG